MPCFRAARLQRPVGQNMVQRQTIVLQCSANEVVPVALVIVALATHDASALLPNQLLETRYGLAVRG